MQRVIKPQWGRFFCVVGIFQAMCLTLCLCYIPLQLLPRHKRFQGLSHDGCKIDQFLEVRCILSVQEFCGVRIMYRRSDCEGGRNSSYRPLIHSLLSWILGFLTWISTFSPNELLLIQNSESISEALRKIWTYNRSNLPKLHLTTVGFLSSQSRPNLFHSPRSRISGFETRLIYSLVWKTKLCSQLHLSVHIESSQTTVELNTATVAVKLSLFAHPCLNSKVGNTASETKNTIHWKFVDFKGLGFSSKF